MRASPLRTDHGFTYVAVLMMVLLIGIMLGVAGQVWTTVMKREREEELLFRGAQIRDAIERWNKPLPGQPPPLPIRDLKDLLQNPYSLQKVRYLRRLYTDPITGKDWELVKDNANRIIGVNSSSKEKPLKQGGFPEPFTDFEGKNSYSDWQFVYRANQGASQGAKSGTPGTSPGTSPGRPGPQ